MSSRLINLSVIVALNIILCAYPFHCIIDNIGVVAEDMYLANTANSWIHNLYFSNGENLLKEMREHKLHMIWISVTNNSDRALRITKDNLTCDTVDSSTIAELCADDSIKYFSIPMGILMLGITGIAVNDCKRYSSKDLVTGMTAALMGSVGAFGAYIFFFLLPHVNKQKVIHELDRHYLSDHILYAHSMIERVICIDDATFKKTQGIFDLTLVDPHDASYWLPYTIDITR